MKHFLNLSLIASLSLISCDTVIADKTIPSTEKAAKIIAAADSQVGKTIHYDPAYVALEYPNGDIPLERGVCTDVIIRAFRTSLKIDLQKQVHLDMKSNFSKYPQKWGLKRPDKNIDHRRVPNLRTYFKRQGWEIPVTKDANNYKPGDIVTSMFPGNRPHIMIVSDTLGSDGNPQVIHNAGGGAQKNGMLFSFPITGHYRIK